MAVAPDSRISSVTVYADRALVHRVATVSLTAVDDTILVPGLPASLDRDSVTVKGRGSARVSILGLDLRREYTGAPLDTEAAAVRDALTALGDREKTLRNRRALLAEKKRYVMDLARAGRGKLFRWSYIRGALPDEGMRVVDFYFKEADGIDRDLESLDVTLREAGEELARLKARWEQVQSPRLMEATTAVIGLDVVEAGDFTAEIRYMVRGARWESLYDIRYDTGAGSAVIEYRAAVTQGTGEDWRDVTLRLSTARPSAGADPPEPSPRYVNFYEPPRAAFPPPAAPAAMPAGMASKLDDMDFCLEEEQAEIRTAEVMSSGGPTVLYAVPGSVSLAADGTARTVAVASFEVNAERGYVLVPELAGVGYITAEAVNASELVFLEGPTRIYRDGDFIGSGSMPLVSPGERFTFHCGEDPRLRGEYECKRENDDSAGITGALKRSSASVKITVVSELPAEERVTVKAARAVSLNRDLKVKSLKYGEKPKVDGEDGIVEWQLLLKPREKRLIEFQYEIEYPKDRVITGW